MFCIQPKLWFNVVIFNCHPELVSGSVQSTDAVENQTFFTKSKILEKVVNQVQHDG